MATIHQDNIGTTVTVTITEDDTALDISAATVITFIFFKPDGELLETTGSFVDDGTDGQVKYVFTDGQLDQSGWWDVQVYLFFVSTQYYSELYRCKISRNLTEIT